ncbi:MAG: bifunctional hydroxymethylpyrimidine kinase/phosphomethylpyrimidine kinase [Chloroflexi bacterium]|nr:bifunctional hydroxymethylpyrimidine kinase/phosphomethylpyrimidine kinase [Chloroflexota bacterium]MCI0575459.1 bifunctional hydroxymethylpyrimidine kinase/phosphomethylpyrimidine kinase [Chloroflexota bacterium]MCI0645407.1 bifunctional hydroxymethylpyrimidine kinase/phosphomethylpyrimidine kinase [Chloroflexota bacterium]MCI0727208.1 bifunctional hydroxymethylpyrimidine kinase/phosphomethylpyrimidine kinase [Chloroflexota bacterium]
MANEPLKLLTIAGSDSGGAAGLQCDLKTFTALNAYGMSVVTAVTAQNSLAVAAVYYLPADFVAAQLLAVLSDYGAAAAKTGFIGRVDIVEAIAATLAAHPIRRLVVDPVLVNHRGEPMFTPAVVQAYQERLLPLATLVTPNRREAALLAGRPVEAVTTIREMAGAAQAIYACGPGAVLVKGGRDGEEMADVLYDGRTLATFRSPRVDTDNLHGSGDTLSAAVCVFLAQGLPLAEAVRHAHHFTAGAIRGGAAWRLGAGHGPISVWGGLRTED